MGVSDWLAEILYDLGIYKGTFFSGKQVAILGERLTGKSHLFHFLAHGKFPAATRNTTGMEKLPDATTRMRVEGRRIALEGSADVPGAESFYPAWREGCHRADWIVYLLRADKVMAEDVRTLKRIENDIALISQSIIERGKPPEKVIIIGTHRDLDPAYCDPVEGPSDLYTDNFRISRFVEKLDCYIPGKPRPVFLTGSLKDEGGAQLLLDEICAA